VALEIVMPRLSDSMEEGTVVRWLVAEGDAVSEGQPLVEVETDKATVTHEAEAEGVILALRVAEGDSVAVGAPIAVIGEPGEEHEPAEEPESVEAWVGAAQAPTASATASPAGPAPSTSTAPSTSPERPADPAPIGRPGRTPASPLARRIAAERGIDLSGLTGSGPNGRVIRADVERSAGGNGAGAPAGTPAPAGSKGEHTVTELNRLQRTIARRMAQSRATVPDFELRAEVDMSEVVALRKGLKEISEEPISYNDFIVKAAAMALREFPRVNGAYDEGKIETFARVNIGIAVAAENALVVPTVFDADTKSLSEIGRESRALAARVRDGSISPSELSGGTFTVSNLGMYGLDSFTAVINPPQAAILAVGSLKPRPVVGPGGEIVARETVHLTLACDHRILYGADGASFLGRLRELLERPLALLTLAL
jgi:pyruvate dehydrogenase E2 component (dihydrolipoamide acetyltransferase)